MSKSNSLPHNHHHDRHHPHPHPHHRASAQRRRRHQPRAPLASVPPPVPQVDRTCHMISAKSFDKLCYDMKQKKDDMGGDLYPHGAREIVADYLVANNQQSRK